MSLLGKAKKIKWVRDPEEGVPPKQRAVLIEETVRSTKQVKIGTMEQQIDNYNNRIEALTKARDAVQAEIDEIKKALGVKEVL